MPAPAAAVVADPGLPALALEAPEQVRAGDSFVLALTLAGPATEGGPVLLAYDTTLVESLDQPGEGGDALALQLPAGTAPRLEVRFRARPGATGLARFGVLSAQLRSGGQVQPLPVGEPLAVRIAP